MPKGNTKRPAPKYSPNSTFSKDWAKKTVTGHVVKKVVDAVTPKKKKTSKSGW